MKTLKVSLIASLIGTVVGLGAWMFGIGQVIWPAHPQLACFLLTLATTIVMQFAWPRLVDTHSS
jgi:H+/Cl- antiporter ClcA